MPMTSFPVPCPCSKCKGTVRELVQHFKGYWFCPSSNEQIVVKESESQARKKKK